MQAKQKYYHCYPNLESLRDSSLSSTCQEKSATRLLSRQSAQPTMNVKYDPKSVARLGIDRRDNDMKLAQVQD